MYHTPLRRSLVPVPGTEIAYGAGPQVWEERRAGQLSLISALTQRPRSGTKISVLWHSNISDLALEYLGSGTTISGFGSTVSRARSRIALISTLAQVLEYLRLGTRVSRSIAGYHVQQYPSPLP
eukprot:1625102-Rhodomonas_salina.1